jgi:hypothetical protein
MAVNQLCTAIAAMNWKQQQFKGGMSAKIQVTNEGRIVPAHTVKAYSGWEVQFALRLT